MNQSGGHSLKLSTFFPVIYITASRKTLVLVPRSFIGKRSGQLLCFLSTFTALLLTIVAKFNHLEDSCVWF